MKILVGVKRVVDYNVRVRLKESGGGLVPDVDNLKMSMNPFDEIALEEAVRLKEKGAASEVIAVTVGAAAAQTVLRDALAAGADRAILVETEHTLEPIEIARIFAVLAKNEQASIVLLGKQAIDDDCNQTGQMLAARLGWAQASFASEVQISGQELTVARETDKGTQTLIMSLPAVITADLRLNEPRYAGLPNIMKARKKPIEKKTLADLGIKPRCHVEVLEYAAPSARKAGIKLENVDALIEKLREDRLIS